MQLPRGFEISLGNSPSCVGTGNKLSDAGFVTPDRHSAEAGSGFFGSPPGMRLSPAMTQLGRANRSIQVAYLGDYDGACLPGVLRIRTGRFDIYRGCDAENRVGLIGWGTVGCGVVRVLREMPRP